jgi:NADPH:quinone reductase
MKAIQVSSFGPPEVLRLTELPDPAPGPGEVAIHAAIGLIDVFIRQGLYRRPRTGESAAPELDGADSHDANEIRSVGRCV